MQMKVLKVKYLESKKVLQNKCRLTRTVPYDCSRGKLIACGCRNSYYNCSHGKLIACGCRNNYYNSSRGNSEFGTAGSKHCKV